MSDDSGGVTNCNPAMEVVGRKRGRVDVDVASVSFDGKTNESVELWRLFGESINLKVKGARLCFALASLVVG